MILKQSHSIIANDGNHIMVDFKCSDGATIRKSYKIITLQNIAEMVRHNDVNIDECYIVNFNYDELSKIVGYNAKLNNFSAADAFFDGTTTFKDAHFVGAYAYFKDAYFGHGGTSFESAIFDVEKTCFFGVSFGIGRLFFYKTNFKGEATFEFSNFKGEITSFEKSCFERITFEDAHFSNGIVSFREVRFGVENVSFINVRFEVRNVDFTKAIFSDGIVYFIDSHFFNSRVLFTEVNFANGNVDFTNSSFGYGEVKFNKAIFGSGTIEFENANFGCGNVLFTQADFGEGNISFYRAQFKDGRISFTNTKLNKSKITFTEAIFINNQISFRNARYTESILKFTRTIFRESTLNFTSFKGVDSTVDINLCNIETVHNYRFAEINRLNIRNSIVQGVLLLNSTDGVDVRIHQFSLEETKLTGHIYLNLRGCDGILEALLNWCDEDNKHSVKSVANQMKLLKENFHRIGEYSFEDEAFLEYMRHNRKNMKGWKRLKRCFLTILDWLGHYATNPARISLWMLGVVLSFALTFFFLLSSMNISPNKKFCSEIAYALYISFLSFLAMGDSEISPRSEITATLMIIEGAIGFFLMSYFIIAVVRKTLR